MARDTHRVPYKDLNIDGQVVSTLHGRPRKSTHINTIRAERRVHNGETTKRYITISRNCVHEMRDTGNIIPLKKGHMKLSPQARKAMNLVLSDPSITGKKLTRHVNKLAGVLRTRMITRDRSVLEVVATVTGSTSPLSSRSSHSQHWNQNASQEVTADLPTVGNSQPQSAQSLPEAANDEPEAITVEEPRVSEARVAGNPGPSRQQPVHRTTTLHGTEIAYGLVTPGVTPAKAPGNHMICNAGEQDVGMDDAVADHHDSSSVFSPGPGPSPSFDSPTPRAGQSQPGVVNTLEDRISALMQENATLLRKEEYVLRTLSRNGQGTISNIEAVADRAVRQRDELRAENQELKAVITRLESGITGLQGEIARIQGKLERAKGDRIEIAQSRRRWIARMWALAGRLPGELRKKDAEIDNIREKLVGMHARLAQEQSTLREVQGQLDEERKNRAGVETELKVAKTAHAQEIRERDLAGRSLKDQLKHVVLGLESGAISI